MEPRATTETAVRGLTRARSASVPARVADSRNKAPFPGRGRSLRPNSDVPPVPTSGRRGVAQSLPPDRALQRAQRAAILRAVALRPPVPLVPGSPDRWGDVRCLHVREE